jgi:hypothetical protein
MDAGSLWPGQYELTAIDPIMGTSRVHMIMHYSQ